MGADLARGFALVLKVGYGFYFTNARVFGVDPGSHGGSELTGTLAGYVEGELMPTLSEDENGKVIAELERVKDFELPKEQIKEIEIKKPGSWGYGFGRIRIMPTTGTTQRVLIRSRAAYDRLVQLTQAFSPELVRTKPFLSL